jgi:hypothetical protein
MKFSDKNFDTIRAIHDGALGFMPAFSGLCPDWSDKTLMQLGASFWAGYHDAGKDPASQEAEDDILGMIEGLYSPAHKAKAATAATFALASLRWSLEAFQKIVTTHTYAAALMASNTTRESFADIVVPWRAFMVVVPDGLLRVVDLDYTRILICVDSSGDAHLVMYAPTAATSFEGPRTISEHHTSLIELLCTDTLQVIGPDGPTEASDVLRRTLELARRLVGGLILAMQHRDNFKTREPREHTGKKREKGEPAHRTVIVGHPIKVDCRPGIRAYLEGRRKHGPPSVQVLVCGHFKRQVIGIGRGGRKVIWVQPYWRGPEDAPILTRPRHLGGDP